MRWSGWRKSASSRTGWLEKLTSRLSLDNNVVVGSDTKRIAWWSQHEALLLETSHGWMLRTAKMVVDSYEMQCWVKMTLQQMANILMNAFNLKVGIWRQFGRSRVPYMICWRKLWRQLCLMLWGCSEVEIKVVYVDNIISGLELRVKKFSEATSRMTATTSKD